MSEKCPKCGEKIRIEHQFTVVFKCGTQILFDCKGNEDLNESAQCLRNQLATEKAKSERLRRIVMKLDCMSGLHSWLYQHNEELSDELAEAAKGKK